MLLFFCFFIYILNFTNNLPLFICINRLAKKSPVVCLFFCLL